MFFTNVPPVGFFKFFHFFYFACIHIYICEYNIKGSELTTLSIAPLSRNCSIFYNDYMQAAFTKIKLFLATHKYFALVIEILAFALSFYLVIIVNKSNFKDADHLTTLDIDYEYQQATQIGAGQNPYAKILDYDLLTNRKFATLLPLYYYFLYIIVLAGNFSWYNFALIYSNVLWAAEMFGALAIYFIFRRENKKALGFVAANFFMFNRWTIANISDGKQDVIAIFLLMASIYLLTSKNKNAKIWAFFVYGLSMGIKHIGVFVAPIFLMPLINREFSFKDLLKGAALFLIPTFGVGIPVIVKNPLAFFYSMLFSFTREPSKLGVEFGYQNLLVLYNVGVEKNNIFYYLLPRLPLVVFSALNLVLLWLKKIPTMLYCLTGLFIFIAFNPMLATQYFTWITPVLFLAGLELKKINK